MSRTHQAIAPFPHEIMPSSKSSSGKEATDWQKDSPFTDDNPFQRNAYHKRKVPAIVITTQHMASYISLQHIGTSSFLSLYLPSSSAHASSVTPRLQKTFSPSPVNISACINEVPRVPASGLSAKSNKPPILPTLDENGNEESSTALGTVIPTILIISEPSKVEFQSSSSTDGNEFNSDATAPACSSTIPNLGLDGKQKQKEKKNEISHFLQPERHSAELHNRSSRKGVRDLLLFRILRYLCTYLFNIIRIFVCSAIIVYLILDSNKIGIIQDNKE